MNQPAISLTPAQVLRLRLRSLLLDAPSGWAPGQIVGWFGAMQAQDLNSGQWSFGVRNPALTQASIAAATENREILRTWPMRGTVHFVPPVDAKWLLELTGVRALAGAPARRKYLGLDESTVNRAAGILGAALAGGKRLTRAACLQLLGAAGVQTDQGRGYHLLWYAAQIGVTCVGPQQGTEQTFVLLDEWVPNPRRPERDEALGELTLRYFRSHGPAGVKDFAGWTGLTMADVRRGLAVAGDALVSIDLDGKPLLACADALDVPAAPGRILLLPGFDEYLLGIKDRSLMLGEGDLKRIVPGSNGIFKPTIVADGKVIGTWQRTLKREQVEITTTPFDTFTAQHRDGIAEAATQYGIYLGLAAKISP